MIAKNSFKNRFDFNKRKAESCRIKKKYKDRLPVIVEISEDSKDLVIDKHKYLCPKNLTCGQLIHVIRKRIDIKSSEALYMFCNNELPEASKLVSQLYQKFADDDGFLYIIISKEKTFGSTPYIQFR